LVRIYIYFYILFHREESTGASIFISFIITFYELRYQA